MVRRFALALLSLQVACLAGGIALQWVLRMQPENPAYAWLLLGMTAPSLLVIAIFFGALVFGGMKVVGALFFLFFTPSRPRR